MFSKSPLIKTIEEALAAGRLDEAFAIAASPAVAGQAAAAKLLRELGEPFLARGQEYLLSKRFADAIADFDRAGRCGSSPEKVAQWRRRAEDAAREDADQQRKKAGAVAEAKGQLAAGSLAGAQQARSVLANDPAGVELSKAIERQAQRAAEHFERAQDALKAGQLMRAIESAREARQLDRRLDGLASLEDKILEKALSETREAVVDGRLRIAKETLSQLGALGATSPQRREMEDLLTQISKGAAALRAGRYDEAGVSLDRLLHMQPGAKWVSQMRDQLAALEEHRRAILAGPLGLLCGDSLSEQQTVVRGRPAMARPANMDRQQTTLVPDVPAVVSSRHSLLRIDGAGSYLIVRGERVSIGRAGNDACADVQLISDLAEKQAEVIRAGEDYFIAARSGVELVGRPVEYALLQDADRLRLGRRVKLTFGRPSQKSSSAVLELGDGVRMNNDCRRVILFAGPILLGAGRECHIRLDPSHGNWVLLERGGQMHLKSLDHGESRMLNGDGVTQIGELRLSLSNEGANRRGMVIG